MPLRRGFLMALLSAALFGAATPASKVLLAGMSAQVLAGLLYLGAALGLAPLCLRSTAGRARWGWPSDRRNRLRLAGAILFGGVIGPVFLLLGLELGRAASVSMWLALETTATAVLARVFFREHMGRWSWFGNVGILLAGALLVAEGGRPALMGALLVAGAAVAWGLDNNLTALIDGISPVQSTFWKGLVAGTTNLSLGLWLDPTAPSVAWGGALALGAVSYGVSIALYISAAQALGAVRSQMVFASAPFFGVVAALVWLGEPLGPWQVAAALILACSLALLFLERHAHEHTHEPLVHTHSHTHDDGHHQHAHPELAPRRRHTHEHVHERQTHSHPHLPDLHHRHSHNPPPHGAIPRAPEDRTLRPPCGIQVAGDRIGAMSEVEGLPERAPREGRRERPERSRRRGAAVRARGSELLTYAILGLVVLPPLTPMVWVLARRRLATTPGLVRSERALTETAERIALFGMVWLALLATMLGVGLIHELLDWLTR